MRWPALLGVLGSLWVWASNDNAPPPAVEQEGVVNAASEMPPEFSGGAIAPGSLFRVHGWRMGPSKTVRAAGYPLPQALAGLSVEIRQGSAIVRAPVVSVSTREIEAILPSAAPPGDDELTVIRDGSRSESFRIRVVPASFGAFYAPGPRRGQGLIRNGSGGDDSVWNGPDHAAQPGQVVTLLGTGLGGVPGADDLEPRRAPVAVPGMRIVVGGAAVRKIAYSGRSASGSGIDELVFEVPPDAPEGCHVPVQVRLGRAASNFVSMAVHRGGGACTGPGDWIRSASSQAHSAGVVVLNRLDFWLRLEDGESARFRVDTALARFVGDLPERGSTDRWLSLPPPGTCTAEEHVTRLRSMLTSVSPLDLIEGTPLDAGEQLTVSGAGGTRRFGKPQGSGNSYGGILGGNSPVPTPNRFPLFLRPGEYSISGDGPGTGAFEARVAAQDPVRWKDRERIAVVDRSRGVTVHWAAASRGDFILLVAVNADSDTGALGRAVCLAPARPGRFTMPAEALTNLPATKAGPGLPLNTLWVFEVPGRPPQQFRGERLDRGIALYVSGSGRTVAFR